MMLLPDASMLVTGLNPNLDVKLNVPYPMMYTAEIFYPKSCWVLLPLPMLLASVSSHILLRLSNIFDIHSGSATSPSPFPCLMLYYILFCCFFDPIHVLYLFNCNGLAWILFPLLFLAFYMYHTFSIVIHLLWSFFPCLVYLSAF